MSFHRYSLLLATALSLQNPVEAAVNPLISKSASSVKEALEKPIFIPNPTRVPEISGLEFPISSVDLPREGDVQRFFRAAREYMRHYKMADIQFPQKNSSSEWTIIPYMIAPQKILSDRSVGDVQIIHLLRRKNARPEGAKDWLLEWRIPESTDFTFDVIGIAPRATNDDKRLAVKSNGSGTTFDIRGKNGEKYIVLATQYPLYPDGKPMVQTPYSEGLSTPENIAGGKAYFAELQETWIRDIIEAPWEYNREFGSMNGISILQAIKLVENMTLAHPNASGQEEQIYYMREIEKFFVLLAVNGPEASQLKSSANARGIVQITPGAWEGYRSKKGEKSPGLKDDFRHRVFANVNYSFDQVVSSHRASLLAGSAHLIRQVQEYANNAKNVLDWMMGKGKAYAPYVLAAGYNSNNTHRMRELQMLLQNYPHDTPEQTMRKFYLGMKMDAKGVAETQGYMNKLPHAMKALGYTLPKISKD